VKLYHDYYEEEWQEEIFATVAHEFTHHMEDTAGLHALDDKDEAELEAFYAVTGGAR